MESEEKESSDGLSLSRMSAIPFLFFLGLIFWNAYQTSSVAATFFDFGQLFIIMAASYGIVLVPWLFCMDRQMFDFIVVHRIIFVIRVFTV